MAAGKIFAISFAISAAMGASFSSAMSRGSAALQQLNEKTRLLNAEQKRLDRVWQESQNQVKMYSRQMQQLQAQYNQGQVSSSQYQSSMARIAENMRSAGMSAEEYRGHLQRLRNEMDQTQNAAKRLQAAQANRAAASANLSSAWAGAQSTLATAGMVAAPFLGAIETAANFEQAMSKVQAITRSDSDAMKMLTDNARMLGETTQFSATQAAQAMSYLGMAGWDANQIIGGMPGLLALAAAGGTDLARTADIVSDDLTAFGLSADQAGHMADVFAVTVTRTNTNVEMLGETMKYAAPVAKAFGASMEETAALAGIMANSGIKASQAGTSLRAGFLRLAGPPKKSAKAMQELGISLSDATKQQQEAQDALKELGISMEDMSGKPKKMSAILTELKNKTAELGQEERLATLQKIFGTEAATGWLAVLDAGPEVFEKLVTEMENSDGEAEKMAKTMMNNAKGAMIQFKSAVEGLAISFGTVFLPAITAGMKAMADMAGRASGWVREHEELVMTIGKIGAAIGAAVVGFKLYRLAAAAVNVLTTSMSLQLELMRKSAMGQRLLAAASQGAAKGMQILRAAMNADLYRNFANNAMLAFNRLRAITWADVGAKMRVALSRGFAGITSGLSRALTAIQAFKTNIIGIITGIPGKLANLARAAMVMWRAFSFAGVLRSVVTGFRAAGLAIQVFARASMAAAFSPLGIALLAIAGAALLIYNNWETVGPFFMTLWEQIQTAFSNAAAMIQPAIDQFIAACQNLAVAVMPILEGLWQTIQNAWAQIVAVFAENSGTIDVVIGIFMTLAEVVGGVLVGAFIGFVSTSVGVMTSFIGSVTAAVTGIIGVLTGIIEFVTGVFTGNWSQAWQGVVDIFSSIFGALKGIADSILGGIMNTVNSIASAVRNIHFGGGGGQEIAANAQGGIYRKGAFLTTFAEDSAEAAIPLDGSPRAIGLWQKAGEILGIGKKANKTASAVMEKEAAPVQKSEPQATMQVVKAQSPAMTTEKETIVKEQAPQNVQQAGRPAKAQETPSVTIEAPQRDKWGNTPNRDVPELNIKQEAPKQAPAEKETVVREQTPPAVQQQAKPQKKEEPQRQEIIQAPAQVVQAEATPVKVEPTAPQVVQAPPQDVNVNQVAAEPQAIKLDNPAQEAKAPERVAPPVAEKQATSMETAKEPVGSNKEIIQMQQPQSEQRAAATTSDGDVHIEINMPAITIQGNADSGTAANINAVIAQAIRDLERRLPAILKANEHNQRRTSLAT